MSVTPLLTGQEVPGSIPGSSVGFLPGGELFYSRLTYGLVYMYFFLVMPCVFLAEIPTLTGQERPVNFFFLGFCLRSILISSTAGHWIVIC